VKPLDPDVHYFFCCMYMCVTHVPHDGRLATTADQLRTGLAGAQHDQPDLLSSTAAAGCNLDSILIASLRKSRSHHDFT
jgi:hypothetical protein